MKEFLKKTITIDDMGNPALIPVSDSAQKYLRKIENGEIVSCEVKEFRNYQQLKMFWACCNTVSMNARRKGFEECDTKEKVAEYVKLKLGYVEYRLIVTDSKGNSHVHLKTKSISYAKMTNDEFKEFLNLALIELEKISTVSANDIKANANHYDTEIACDK